MSPDAVIKGLGEVALRVNDLDSMQEFYQDVVGLELMRRFPASAFFRIAEGYGGHTEILALFDRSGDPGYERPKATRSTNDHLAFQIDLSDFRTEKARLEGLGQDVREVTHAWVKWRSLYITDPEGNMVEFVCYDATIDG